MHLSDSPERSTANGEVVRSSEVAKAALDNLFEVSPDAIFVTDAQGVIRGANPRAAELFGYGQAEFVGMRVEQLIPARFRGRHPEHRENYHAHPRMRQMGVALNLFGLRKDGSEFPVDIMLKPMASAGEPLVLSFLRDVTEQREAIERLRRADEQIRSIVESVNDYAIYLLDKDGCVSTWNPGAEKIKGYSTEDVLGRNYSMFFTQEDVERGRPTELLRLAAERGRVEGEGWRVRKDGSRFWANIVVTAIHDATGAVTGYAKVARDFTNRKRAEEAVLLQLSTALLANMDVRALLGALSASLREVVPHECAMLGLHEPHRHSLMEQFIGEGAERSQGHEVKLELNNSPSARAFNTREPVLVSRVQEAQFPAEGMRHVTSLGVQSGCWVPLVHRGEAVGTLMVGSRIEGAYTERDAAMLMQMGDQVAMAVSNAQAYRQIAELRDKLSQEKRYLEEEINLENRFEDIVGESAGLRTVLKQIETVAPTDATVLIQGETGTGKELLARAIHRLSPRSDRTFIKLNCAAIPAGLLESELFGHEKGAFTGAIARKVGRLELAHEGTLFLDEIGEMPLDLQPKLLRALQEREIERLGGNRPIPVNVRLIAATNRDLAQMVADKEFRSDLFYRLKVFPIFAPPLRDRSEDIPTLVRHFVAAHSRRMGKSIVKIPDATMKALMRWSWPGNIRELENMLERAVILTRGPELYVPLAELELPAEQQTHGAPESPTLRSAERDHILRVLRETNGQIGGDDGAAARLGLKRTTLNSKLKKLGIERADYM
jgi:PAS domain S-box-containing protein